MRARIKKPRVFGDFVHVYQPGGDSFPGPDSVELQAGRWYDDWIPNDHHLVKGRDGRWHLFGITHPATSSHAIHDGEWLLFHAVSRSGVGLSALQRHAFRDEKKVLPPAARPGEPYSIHSPYIVERGGRYVMVYGPDPFRHAVSDDLWVWEPQGEFFAADLAGRAGGAGPLETDPAAIEKKVSAGDVDRDPMILEHAGAYHMVYCSRRNTVELTSSTDCLTWSKPTTVLQGAVDHHPESPVLVHTDGHYYLFTCFWINNAAGKREPYANRTLVYASPELAGFAESATLIGELPVHAPEIVRDDSGDWFITSAERPHRGVSLARLVWE